jgi:hypothetical protein
VGAVTHSSAHPAQVFQIRPVFARHAVRRNIDAVVMQIRREIAEACNKAADECGEPLLDDDARDDRR